MAEDVTPEPTAPALAEQRTSYAGRFTLVYAVLALILGAALATFVIFLARPSGGGPSGSAAWSPWQPADQGPNLLAEIANHVAPRYRMPGGTQLVRVDATVPSVAVPSSSGGVRFPVASIAVAQDTDPPGYAVYPSNLTVQYSLCGDGGDCSLPRTDGISPQDRGLHLQREALELALYSFQYLNADAVLELLPPAPDGTTRRAIYLRREDLAAQLAQPLSATIDPVRVPVLGHIGSEEARRILELTGSHVYDARYQQQLDQTFQVILDRPQG